MKKKICVFSVKIITQVFGKDNKLVDRIKFAEMVEAPDIDKAFEKVQRSIRQKAARRGYRKINGYHLQYHLYSPFKKLWETTVPSN